MSSNTQPQNQERTLDMSPNTAALLCYLGIWISGIVFLILEQKNRYVRFHALQSIIVFGFLTLAASILGNLPVIGVAFSSMITITGFILWVVLMVKAYQGESFKLPGAGELAENLTSQTMSNSQTVNNPSNTNNPSYDRVENIDTAANRLKQKAEFKEKYYSFSARAGRVVASSFAIAWSIALLIFFNFFNQYIAVYIPADNIGGKNVWNVYPVVTGEFSSWLPIITATLIIAIIGHIIMISWDKYIVRQIVKIIVTAAYAVSVFSLFVIYPFSFSGIPDVELARVLAITLSITLVIIGLGLIIGTIARFVKTIVHIADGRY